MPGIDFSEIKSRVTCTEFARTQGIKLKRGRAQCVFHNGRDFNLAIYDDGCYCYVCHQGGDVIRLASAWWRVPQNEAAHMLNDEFRLGLSSERMTAEEREQRQRERAAEEQKREEAKQAEAREWSQAADDLREAERAADRLQGLTVADVDNPVLWSSLARLARAQERWFALGGR